MPIGLENIFVRLYWVLQRFDDMQGKKCFIGQCDFVLMVIIVKIFALGTYHRNGSPTNN